MHAKDGLGARLKAARDALGYTQSSMGPAVGSAGRSWQDYERNVRTPGSDVIAGLVRLGINANWILTGEGKMLLRDQAVPTPTAAAVCDLAQLQLAIATVEEGLAETGRTMRPGKKAELVLAVYELFADTAGKVDRRVVLKLVRSAS